MGAGKCTSAIGKCTSNLLLGTASTIFMIVGLTITVASVASITTFVKELVPLYGASISIGIGAGIMVFAAMGYAAMCTKTSRKLWLGAFMTFDVILFIGLAIMAGVMWRTQESLESLKSQNFVNTSNIEGRVSGYVKTGVENVYSVCGAKVVPIIDNVHFLANCSNTEWQRVADFVNGGCLGPTNPLEIFEPNSTRFSRCYEDESFWSNALATSFPGPYTMANLPDMMDKPKGVFCSCSDQLTDLFIRYFAVIKWSATGVALFFGLVFIACCFLCCCVKEQKEQQQDSAALYMARA